MDNIGKEVLEKIKQDRVKPKPRWEFLLKDYVMWLLFAAGIFIGSLATAVIIFIFFHTNYHYGGQASVIKELLIAMPFFWFFVVLLMIAVAFYNIRHTNKGYKYNPVVIVLGSVVISLILGTVVYATGGAEDLEEVFYQRVPIYKIFIHERAKMLVNPAQGSIAGVVVAVNPDNIVIQDFRGYVWKITTTTEEFRVGQRVRLLGHMVAEHEFGGQAIKPWFNIRLRPPLPALP